MYLAVCRKYKNTPVLGPQLLSRMRMAACNKQPCQLALTTVNMDIRQDCVNIEKPLKFLLLDMMYKNENLIYGCFEILWQVFKSYLACFFH